MIMKSQLSIVETAKMENRVCPGPVIIGENQKKCPECGNVLSFGFSHRFCRKCNFFEAATNTNMASFIGSPIRTSADEAVIA